jgi:hypothetical protein
MRAADEPAASLGGNRGDIDAAPHDLNDTLRACVVNEERGLHAVWVRYASDAVDFAWADHRRRSARRDTIKRPDRAVLRPGCRSSSHVRLVNLNDVSVRILEKHLIPPSDRPLPVV